MSDDDNKNKPLVFGSQNSLSHNYICEPRNEVSLLLLGGKSSHGVEFTQDQVSNLARWLEIDPKDVVDRSTDSSIESFTKAGNWRNISRYAHIHGLRLMGFLAGRGLLEKGKDPVESLAEMLYDYLEEPFALEVNEEDKEE